MATSIESSFQKGARVRVVEGNVFGGYPKGLTGRVAAVLRNAFTGDLYYRCEMDGPGRRTTLILLPEEIEPLPEAALRDVSPAEQTPFRDRLSL